MTAEIHPTAVICPGAEIGNDVVIGPFCMIGPKVTIGDGTKLGSHVVIDGRTTLGKENELSHHCVIGGLPQDLKYRGEDSTLIIGDRNKIREFVTIHIGTATGRMETRVGNSNLFMANSHVAHDCLISSNNVLANSVALAGHVSTGDGVIIGGLVGVHQFCRIGSYAIVSAGSMVGRDIPPFCMVQGDRATLRGLNLIGMRRAGLTGKESAAVKRAFRHFFTTNGHHLEKLQTLDPELAANPRVQVIIRFIQEPSKRGTCSSRLLATDSEEFEL